MTRTRRADCSSPGLTRRRRGQGFSYVDERTGRAAGAEDRVRIADLAIPPAWRDVWICPDPLGHIQATGIDAAGRKQYLYHPAWRVRRDQAKFDEMLDFARRLPRMRRRLDAALEHDEMGRERVLACAVRLLDLGFFRIGSETYAERNESYGLATMRREHVSMPAPDVVVFDYPAKHGRRRVQRVVDPVCGEIVATLRRRRGGGDELLAYKEGGRWRDVRSDEINGFIKASTGLDASAKDFRTWNATVLAGVSLAVVDKPASSRATERAIRWAIEQVAHHLGNTPAVARSAYIDPRVFDRFRDGRTIERSLATLGEDDGSAIQGPIERAVIRLLD